MITPNPPTQKEPQGPDLICGVDRYVIERFLVLIRDNYRQADKATYFLEEQAGISNVAGITNMRDVLSHLATALSPEISQEKRVEQLTNAEEHLRRAIVEPYELAFRERLDKFRPLYNNYVNKLLKVKDRYVELQNAPNAVSLNAVTRKIANLAEKGRGAKNGNIWTGEWEEGVSCFIEAYETLLELEATIRDYWNQYESKKTTILGIQLGVWGLIIGVLGIVISILLVIFPEFGNLVRAFFGGSK